MWMVTLIFILLYFELKSIFLALLNLIEDDVYILLFYYFNVSRGYVKRIAGNDPIKVNGIRLNYFLSDIFGS
jgi:hypothetical protein